MIRRFTRFFLLPMTVLFSVAALTFTQPPLTECLGCLLSLGLLVNRKYLASAVGVSFTLLGVARQHLDTPIIAWLAASGAVTLLLFAKMKYEQRRARRQRIMEGAEASLIVP